MLKDMLRDAGKAIAGAAGTVIGFVAGAEIVSRIYDKINNKKEKDSIDESKDEA